MNIKKLITDLQVCADDDILCTACERYGTMGVIGGSAECVEELFREAAAALEEMQKRISEAEEKGRWIPVTERLPEPGMRVIATDGTFSGEMYINKRGQWQRYNVNDSSLLMALDILWWMPLPEPPKEV